MKGKDKKITMAEVAKKAGVSAATVSRALDGSSLITQRVQERIKKTATDLGYHRRRHLRHAERSILTIKLVLPTAARRSVQLFYSFSELVEGLRTGLEPSSANIIVETESPNYLPFPHKKGGVIDAFVFAFHRPKAALLAEISEQEIPCIVLNRRVRGVRQVLSDHGHAMSLIADHLAEKGVRGECCFVSYDGIEEITTARLRGFEQGCRESGIAFEAERDQLRLSHPESLSGRQVEELYAKGIRTFVGVNDVMAMILMQRVQAKRLSVPNEVRLTGCDRGPLWDLTEPSLTTVEISVAELARVAGKSIQEEIVKKEKSVASILVKGKLIRGKTT